MSKGCGIEFPHFGASYPDARCCDGYLWDMDSWDESLDGFTVGGEEPVSEELKEFEVEYFESEKDNIVSVYDRHAGLVDGANWQKEHLWKSADGNDLPEIDREVIALLDNGKVVFAHRPPEYWDGKNIVTGKVTRNYPKTYDKGGWNIPDVKYWLDVKLPKEIEL